MTAEKGIIRKKKENVTITLSPYLKKQLDVMVESGDFSSLSDLATMALTEFVAKYNAEKKQEIEDQPEENEQPIKETIRYIKL